MGLSASVSINYVRLDEIEIQGKKDVADLTEWL